MLTAIVVLRLVAASQVALSVAALASSNNPPRVRVIGSTLAIGIVAYLVVPIAAEQDATVTVKVLALAAELIPLLLFGFTWSVFEDSPRLARTRACVGFIYVAAALSVTVDRAAVPALSVVLQFAKLALAIAAIYIIWKGREEDLVEARLKLRPAFMVGLALAVVVVVSAELVARWHVPAPIELVGMGAILLLSFAINLAFLKFNPAFALVVAPSEPALPPQSPDPIIAELLRLMTEERLYAEHGLRIGALARRLKVSEHQLRRAINRQLGHRNFSQFVNRYRLEEAAQRLVSEPRTPVLTLALDVGFRSMSSFNTAFRTHFGAAPTAYRAKALSNS